MSDSETFGSSLHRMVSPISDAVEGIVAAKGHITLFTELTDWRQSEILTVRRQN